MLEEELTCPYCQGKITLSVMDKERIIGSRTCDLECESCHKKIMVISIDGAFNVIRRE